MKRESTLTVQSENPRPTLADASNICQRHGCDPPEPTYFHIVRPSRSSGGRAGPRPGEQTIIKYTRSPRPSGG
jgi:hypothetical protein